ncbi:Hypothetical predicted protein [Olea europaea subsp. europaea]|uniref:Uncharacterized protein n=1 Tax=Olea europaea subsp. europaea TaxID=158383 RepID=A0A8S0UA49_OLEEU|nr:Hypothetical predicted protein [Olea europaea subsp. europaea]
MWNFYSIEYYFALSEAYAIFRPSPEPPAYPACAFRALAGDDFTEDSGLLELNCSGTATKSSYVQSEKVSKRRFLFYLVQAQELDRTVPQMTYEEKES